VFVPEEVAEFVHGTEVAEAGFQHDVI